MAVRRLLRTPGFAALAVGLLTVGIGINAAMVVLLDALLLRPPPHIAEPDEVVRVQFRPVDGRSRGLHSRTNYPTLLDLRASRAFADVAAYDGSPSVSIGLGRDAYLADAMLVSDEFFRVLRTVPRLGRLSPGVGDVVISSGFWQRHFGGDPGALGGTVMIDGYAHSVVGVLPGGFPNLSGRMVDIWLPLGHVAATGWAPSDWRANGNSWLGIVARLPQGSTASVAEQRASTVLRGSAVAPSYNAAQWTAALTSVIPGRGEDGSLETRVSLWLAGVSTVVLLIACANVSNLVSIRVFARRRESFVRLVLGASRWDFLRRSVIDTSSIVLPAALGALLVSFLVRNAVAAFLSGEIPLSRAFQDARAAGILAGSVALAFVLVWAASSLQQLRLAKADAGMFAGAAHDARLGRGARRLSLAVQAGLCFVLLSAAGLFATSLRRAEDIDLGVDLERTVQLTINFARQGQSGSVAAVAYERAVEALRRHPGVERVAVAGRSPYMSGSGASPWTTTRSRDELWSREREVAYRSAVGAGFFSTVGAQSLRGRDFDDRDIAGAPLVAIVNESLARHLWPYEDALGQCMWMHNAPTCVRVVGVLGGAWKFSALRRDVKTVYLPLRQAPEAAPGSLFIRAESDASGFVAEARSIIQSVNPDLPAADGVLARSLVDGEFRPWRLAVTVFSAFAAVALLITAIGLYGMVTASFALRTRETGIRLALGARWTHVLGATVGEGMLWVAIGLCAGFMVVIAGSRWLGGVLFETSARDPVVLIQCAIVLMATAVLAVAAPAARAFLAQPVDLLRHGNG